MTRLHPEVFVDMDWGTNAVLEETCERVRNLGLELALLPVWYDVDRPEDLRFLKTHLDLMEQSGVGTPAATARFLRQLKF